MDSPHTPQGPVHPTEPAPPAVPQQRLTSAGGAGPRGAAGVSGPARRPGRAPLRLVLAVVGGMLLLLCLGGAGIAFVYYDEATKPNRSAPDVVVDNYLRAILVNRDAAAARQYECKDAQLAEMEGFIAAVQSQEQRLDTQVSISWGELVIREATSGNATVDVSLRRSALVDGASQSLVDPWQFTVSEDDGWRVCAAIQRG